VGLSVSDVDDEGRLEFSLNGPDSVASFYSPAPRPGTAASVMKPPEDKRLPARALVTRFSCSAVSERMSRALWIFGGGPGVIVRSLRR
jgi:hypothetical protein